jgi:chemotaxis protein methyltransferase CheR
MKPDDFDLLTTMLRQRSGLVLTREKAYLLESRLLPVVRKHSLKTLEDLIQAIRTKRDEAMIGAVIQAMTTNDTLFFRDRKPFERFRSVLLPHLLSTRADKHHIRIWSAGTSSGQEAYSLAMICLEEAAKLQDWKIDIIGTDLSHAMIERARTGIYSQFEVQRGLPVRMLVKYFQPLGDGKWQMREDIRQMVQFQEVNLVQDLGPIGVFDLVFCRNVMSYFDSTIKRRVLDSMAAVMAPDGMLALGDGETIKGISDKFKPLGNDEQFLVRSSAGETLAGLA